MKPPSQKSMNSSQGEKNRPTFLLLISSGLLTALKKQRSMTASLQSIGYLISKFQILIKRFRERVQDWILAFKVKVGRVSEADKTMTDIYHQVWSLVWKRIRAEGKDQREKRASEQIVLKNVLELLGWLVSAMKCHGMR